MRARTSHDTFGSVSSSFGALELSCVAVSTGYDLGGRSIAGVPVPGVAGGVKAGLINEAGGS